MKIIYKISAYVCLVSMLNMIFTQTLWAMRQGLEGADDASLNLLPPGQTTASQIEIVTEPPHSTTTGAPACASSDYTLLEEEEDEPEELTSSGMITPSKVRWSQMDRFPTALVLYPFLKVSDIDASVEVSTRYWLKGHGVWLHSQATLTKAFAVDGFRQGFEFILMRGMHVGILALTWAQLAKTTSFSDFLGLFHGGEKYALTALAYNAQGSSYVKGFLFAFMALPFVWGGVKASLASRNAQKDPDAAMDTALTNLEEAQDRSSSPIWKDGLRWFLPLHPLDRQLNNVTRLLRWDGRLSQDKRDKGFKALKDLHNSRGGYTKIITGFQLAQLANSVQDQDTKLLETKYGPEILAQRQRMAQDSRDLIKHMARYPRDSLSHVSTLYALPTMGHYLYGRYLQWWLGDSPTRKESAAWWTFKLGKTAVSLLFFYTLGQAISDYLSCPQKQGISFTGPEPWSSDFSQSCFDELVRQFNTFPGQPASTLVDLLPQYYFPTGTYLLDLSKKEVNASVITSILNGFQEKASQGLGPILTGLNFDNMNLGDQLNLEDVILALPLTLQTLSFSNNNIAKNDCINVNSMVALGKKLKKMQYLTFLNLSGNQIGGCDDRNSKGTEALGESLKGLASLTTLDLSNNNIGAGNNNNGTIALGKGIGYLHSLKILNLQSGGVGTTDIETFCDSIGHLTLLESLDLSSNNLGFIDLEDPIHNCLRNLTSLIELNLSYNYIGIFDNFVQGVGMGLGKLKSLTSLDLSNNEPCEYCEDNCQVTTQALANGISQLTSLTFLDLSSNQGILCTYELPRAIGMLSSLRVLNISRNYDIGEAINGTEVLGESIARLSSLRFLDLSNNQIGYEYYIDPGITDIRPTEAIATGITKLNLLTSLDLSNNLIGSNDFRNASGTQALGIAIKTLTQLNYLSLSGNQIGSNVSSSSLGIQYLAQAFKYLTNLKTLLMLPNPMTPSVLRLFNEALQVHDGPLIPRFIKLNTAADVYDYFQGISSDVKSLNLSGLMINSNAEAMIALMDTLITYPSLQMLDLSDNGILLKFSLSKNADIFGERIGHLKSLVFLNLANNDIGNPGSQGIETLGVGLSNLTVLTHLDLSRNDIGTVDYTDPSRTIAMGTAIGNLGSLKLLNLSGNMIGGAELHCTLVPWPPFELCFQNTTGTQALGEGIRQLSLLETLDLSNNYNDNPMIAVSGMGFGTTIASGIKRLQSLLCLDLSGNGIGSYKNFTAKNLGEAIRSLQVLETLDISRNMIGLYDQYNSNVTGALGQAFCHLTNLRSLHLQDNSIGLIDSVNPQGTKSLGQCLGHLITLEFLDLSNNMIGYNSSSGEIAICQGISLIQNLHSLNIGGNYIGSTDQEGPAIIVQTLTSSLLTDFNISGLLNASWTDGAQAIAHITNAELKQSCENQLCFGTALNTSDANSQNTVLVSSSRAENLLVNEEEASEDSLLNTSSAPFSDDMSTAHPLETHPSWSPSVFLRKALRLSVGLLLGSQMPNPLALTAPEEVIGMSTFAKTSPLTGFIDDFHPRSMPTCVSLSYPLAGFLLVAISIGFVYLYTKLFPKKPEVAFRV